MADSVREENLRAGNKELHGIFVLYWEPYSFKLPGDEESRIGHAFTVDGPQFRGRYVTLDAALADLEVLKRRHATEIAIKALMPPDKGDTIKIIRPPRFKP